MTTAAVYLRISKDPKNERLGVDRQLDACQELVRQRGWHTTPSWILDENDTSATRGTRPKFERLLDGIRSGEVGAVVAYDLDRLQRSLMDLARLIDLAERRDVPIVTVTGGFDLSDPRSKGHATLIGAIASIETANLSARLRAKSKQNAQAGKVVNGGRRPYGYTVDRKGIVPEEAAVIQEVADRLIAGKSLTSIAKDLNQRGIFTGGGRRWDSRRLREVMARPRLCGRVVHRGDVVKKDDEPIVGEWPAILGAALWEEVQIAMSARRPVDDRWTNKRKYLLSGTLLRCGVCGEKMHVHKSTAGVAAYRCRSHLSRNMTLTDAFVLSELKARADEVTFQVAEWHDPEQADIADRIALERRKAEVARQFADGSIPADMVRTMAQHLEDQIHALREQQAASFTFGLEARAAKFDLGDWDAMTLEEQRSALALYIDRIVVHPQKTRGRGAFDTAALEIVWRHLETMRFRAVVEQA